MIYRHIIACKHCGRVFLEKEFGASVDQLLDLLEMREDTDSIERSGELREGLIIYKGLSQCAEYDFSVCKNDKTVGCPW
jgi:hypothetical protein